MRSAAGGQMKKIFVLMTTLSLTANIAYISVFLPPHVFDFLSVCTSTCVIQVPVHVKGIRSRRNAYFHLIPWAIYPLRFSDEGFVTAGEAGRCVKFGIQLFLSLLRIIT